MQLKDSLGNLLEERRQKITISAVTAWQELTADFVAKEEGEVTVFIDNSDTEPVYFDELELRVERTPTLVITQEHHYYPFGMNMSGIERQGDLMYQFNGMVEKEEAFGLELYETPFRSYDAQLGRFWQVEPLADIYVGVSMYQFAYNNPISFNDPTGLSSDTGEPSPPRLPPPPPNQRGGTITAGNTWELGNTRGQPYSMGGTPGQGPAMITIVNFDKDKDVTAAISIVNTSLQKLGVNAVARQVFSGEGIGQEHVTGINATYLFGALSQDGIGSRKDGKNYENMYKLAARLENNDHNYSIANIIKRKAFKFTHPESTSGWKYSNGKMISAIGGSHTNLGAVSLEHTMGKLSMIGDSRIAVSRPQFLAMIILHMMGHTSGLDHTLGVSDDIQSSGSGLLRLLESGRSYNSIIHGNTSSGHFIWQNFVKNYFSSTWNGNPNASFAGDITFKDDNIYFPYSHTFSILRLAIQRGEVRN